MNINKKNIILKIIYGFILSLLIPVIIGFFVNIVSFIITKPRIEVTFKLDNYLTLGYIKDSNLPLSMTWEDKPIRNIMKISWIVENTGTKGIEYFEQDPIISYPFNSVVASATISHTSPRLLIDENILIDPKKSNISLGKIGVLNKEDFFCVVTYITDFNESEISPEFFEGWDLEARAVDLNVKKVIKPETSKYEKDSKKGVILLVYFVAVVSIFSTYYITKFRTLLNIKIKEKKQLSFLEVFSHRFDRYCINVVKGIIKRKST